jgi:hypothetical protein
MKKLLTITKLVIFIGCILLGLFKKDAIYALVAAFTYLSLRMDYQDYLLEQNTNEVTNEKT